MLLQSGLGGIAKAFTNAIRAVILGVANDFFAFVKGVINDLLEIMTGTPHPVLPGYNPFAKPVCTSTSPLNCVWVDLYEMYWGEIVPASFILLIAMWAISTSIYGASPFLSSDLRKMKRNVFLALPGIILWWPFMAIITNIAHGINMFLYADAEIFSNMESLLGALAVGGIVYALFQFLSAGVFILAGIFYAARWAAIPLLTVGGPILIVAKVPAVGWFKSFTRKAEGYLGASVGLAFATFPTAIAFGLFGVLTQSGGIIGFLIALVLPLLGVYLSWKMIPFDSRGGVVAKATRQTQKVTSDVKDRVRDEYGQGESAATISGSTTAPGTAQVSAGGGTVNYEQESYGQQYTISYDNDTKAEPNKQTPEASGNAQPQTTTEQTTLGKEGVGTVDDDGNETVLTANLPEADTQQDEDTEDGPTSTWGDRNYSRETNIQNDVSVDRALNRIAYQREKLERAASWGAGKAQKVRTTIGDEQTDWSAENPVGDQDSVEPNAPGTPEQTAGDAEDYEMYDNVPEMETSLDVPDEQETGFAFTDVPGDDFEIVEEDEEEFDITEGLPTTDAAEQSIDTEQPRETGIEVAEQSLEQRDPAELDNEFERLFIHGIGPNQLGAGGEMNTMNNAISPLDQTPESLAATSSLTVEEAEQLIDEAQDFGTVQINGRVREAWTALGYVFVGKQPVGQIEDFDANRATQSV